MPIFQIIDIEVVKQLKCWLFNILACYLVLEDSLEYPFRYLARQEADYQGRSISVSGQWYQVRVRGDRQQEHLHGARLFRKARWAHD